MNINDLAYIAGLFDGEGSATIRMVKGPNGKRYPRIEARICQQDRMVLDWIVNEFQCGAVYSKSDKTAKNECFDARFSYRTARVFLTAIEPYLRIKKENITKLLDISGRDY